MNLEAAPYDASSSLYAQKKRKKHEKRHNSMENNHTDYGHREGTSSMVNSPLDNDSPQEPPASSWAKGAFWVKTESSKATERLEEGGLFLEFQLEATVPLPGTYALISLLPTKALSKTPRKSKSNRSLKTLGDLKEDEARRYFQQLVNVLDYCHSEACTI